MAWMPSYATLLPGDPLRRTAGEARADEMNTRRFYSDRSKDGLALLILGFELQLLAVVW